MNINTIFFAGMLACAAVPAALAFEVTHPTVVQEASRSVSELYHDFAKANDLEGLAALWKQNETRVLGTIDRDLEGSLAIWEKATQAGRELNAAESAMVKEKHARALFGARAATAAFDRPIFHDYAASFCSWNAQQKQDFRAGQSAFGDAMKAMGQGEFEAALAAAERCTKLAMPLGDWWGSAMGLGLSGMAKAKLDQGPAALADLAQSRLLNQALGLLGAERRDLDSMLQLLMNAESWQRALATCDALIGTPTAEQAASHEIKTLRETRAKIVTAIG